MVNHINIFMKFIYISITFFKYINHIIPPTHNLNNWLYATLLIDFSQSPRFGGINLLTIILKFSLIIIIITLDIM